MSPRRAAVLGSPIAHSRSPLLHTAAYAALGLDDWTYERVECTAEQLPEFVRSRGPEWVGMSVTMPGKFAALEVADSVTPRAAAVGSANTLTRSESGWTADNTDVDGVTGALASIGVTDLAGASATVVGAGGTARPALIALQALGVRSVTLVSRDEQRAAGAADCGRRAGLDVRWMSIEDAGLREVAADCAALVSTVPAGGAAGVAPQLASAPVVLDAIYDPWPTPLAAAVEAAGGRVVGGLAMLLNQAYGQVELFTGMPAPRAAMAAALEGEHR